MKRIKYLFFLGIMCLTSFVAMAFFAKAPVEVNADSIPNGQKLDTIVDTISVSDLTFNGLSNQTMVVHNERKNTATFNFRGENTNKNLVFKFIYDVVDDTNSDSIQTRIHFDVGDDVTKEDKINILNIQGNMTGFSRNSNGWGYAELARIPAGRHLVEYGRIALLDSGTDEPTGSYYVYYKLDNVEIRNNINDYTGLLSKMDGQMYLYYSSGNTQNTIYDANLTYETPQNISISDLKDGENPVGNTVTNTGNSIKLTYDTNEQPTNKSVVFTANMHVRNNADDAQIYIYNDSGASGNVAGYIYIKSSENRVYFGKGDSSGSIPKSYTFADDTDYRLEYGRLAVMNGDSFTGRYHVYVKIDNNLVYAIDQSIVAACASGGRLKFNGTSGFQFSDTSAAESVYETPDEISIEDLEKNDVSVGKSLFLNANQYYSYDSTAAHKSVVFRFKYVVYNQSSVDCQVHFSDSQLSSTHGGILWFRNDKNRISKVGGGYIQANPFASAGVYEVELSKIYIVSGANSGKYEMTMSIDGVQILDYIIEDMPDKANVYFTGKNGDRLYDINCTVPTFETPDEISVSDLKKGGNSFGSIAFLSAATNYSYTATAEHKSVIFRFKYECNIPSTVECQFHFYSNYLQYAKDGQNQDTNPGNAGVLWFQSNGSTHIKKMGDGYVNGGNVFTTAGLYDVELGKLYITAGEGVGNYYLYIKVGNKIIIDYVISTMPDTANIYLTGTNNDRLLDINYNDIFEEADEISIGDLRFNGQRFGNLVALDGNKNSFSYASTAAHKSVVYKFKYEVADPDAVNHQFHFADDYAEKYGMLYGMFWIRESDIKMRTAQGVYDTFKDPFTAAGTYNVELGKLYVTSGTNAGKYYVYLKVDNKLYGYGFADAMPDKANLFITASNSDILYDMDYAPCNGTHTLEHNEAVASTCTSTGNVEYWWCSNCGKYFSDSNGTNEINTITTAALDHSLEHHEAVAETCTTNGNVEYWECSSCHAKFSDENGENALNNVTIPATGHNLQHHDAQSANCTEAGNVEYWECSVCHAKFSDENGANALDNVIIPATGHDFGELIAQVNPTCTEPGVKEHKDCSVCSKHFDKNGVEIDNLVLPALGHNWDWVIDKEATVLETGLKHEECTRENCDAVRSENTVIPVLECNHNLQLTEAVAATCTTQGRKAYYTCTECHKHFSDAQGQNEILDLEAYLPVATIAHSTEFTQAVDPKCTTTGNKACYTCTVCGKHFSDAEGTNEIDDFVVNALGHDLIDDAAVPATCTETGKTAGHHCSRCDYTDGGETTQALGHDLVDDAAVPATCTETGKTAGHHCSRCDYTDGGETIPVVDHTFGELIAQVNPTCAATGTKEHKDCSVCHKHFDKDGNPIDDLSIPATGHSTQYHALVYPTLENPVGNVKYYECSVCGKKYSDSGCTNELTEVVLTLEEAKQLGVRDLRQNGNPFGGRYNITSNTDLTYDNSDHKDNYSIVFKFRYEVIDNKQNQFHLSCTGTYKNNEDKDKEFKWASASSFIINNNGSVHLGKSKTDVAYNVNYGYHDMSYAMTIGETYEIEYGRIAIMNGETFSGYYHLYLKINGVVIKEDDRQITQQVVEGNLLFFNADGKNVIYDMNYVPEAYEQADEVSIRDLKKSGNDVGNNLFLSKDTAYSYVATAEHKSVVFKFKYDCLNPDTVGCQIHFNDRYLEKEDTNPGNYGIIWLRNDKTFVKKLESGYKEAVKAFPEAGLYNCEVGKLYVTAGDNEGKYYIYLKVNDVLIIDYYVNVFPDKANIFLTGKNNDRMFDINYVQDVFEEADQVSIGDLKLNGKAFGNVAKLNADKNYTYTATAEHKSVVYKFKYEVDDLSKVSCQFHFADRYSENEAVGKPAGMIWLTENKVYLRISATDYIDECNENKKPFAEVGTYNVEIGKLYVTEGTNAEKYYVYLKINDKLIIYRYVDELADMANLFLTGKQGGRLLDMDFVPCEGNHTLEHVDAIAPTCTKAGAKEYWWCTNCSEFFSDEEGENLIEDLAEYLPVAALGHNLELTEAVAATCTAQGAKAYYTCSRCGIHFVDEEGEEEIEDLEEYLPVAALGHDLVDDAAIPATCTEAGKEAGKHCSRCDYTEGGATTEALGHDYQWVVDKAATVLESGLKHEECTRCHDKRNEGTVIEKIDHNHELVKTDAVAPTCTAQGAKAYYTCSVCQKHFSDEAGQLEIEDLEAYLPVKALGHDLVDDAAIAATCTTAGKEAGKHCSRCDYTEGGATIPAKGHTFGELVAGVAATCTEAGVKEHKDCSVCNKHFTREGEEIADINIPALGHTLVHHDAVAATCTTNGSIEYWECSVCNKKFSNAQGTTEVIDIVIPAQHRIEHVEAKAPKCTEEGNIEYYICSVCGKKYSDANCTTEVTDVVLSAQHNLVHRDAKAATCTEDGNIEYYHCSECGKNFSDAQGKNQVNSVIVTGHHTLTKVEAKDATCDEDGNIEYYVCSDCGKKFADDEGRTEIADVKVEAIGHQYDRKGFCTICGQKDPDAKRGCKSSISAGAIVFLVGLTLVIFKKKREQY